MPLGPGIAVIVAIARFSSTVRVVRMDVRVMGGITGNMLGTGMTGIAGDADPGGPGPSATQARHSVGGLSI